METVPHPCTVHLRFMLLSSLNRSPSQICIVTVTGCVFLSHSGNAYRDFPAGKWIRDTTYDPAPHRINYPGNCWGLRWENYFCWYIIYMICIVIYTGILNRKMWHRLCELCSFFRSFLLWCRWFHIYFNSVFKWFWIWNMNWIWILLNIFNVYPKFV